MGWLCSAKSRRPHVLLWILVTVFPQLALNIVCKHPVLNLNITSNGDFCFSAGIADTYLCYCLGRVNGAAGQWHCSVTEACICIHSCICIGVHLVAVKMGLLCVQCPPESVKSVCHQSFRGRCFIPVLDTTHYKKKAWIIAFPCDFTIMPMKQWCINLLFSLWKHQESKIHLLD